MKSRDKSITNTSKSNQCHNRQADEKRNVLDDLKEKNQKVKY